MTINNIIDKIKSLIISDNPENYRVMEYEAFQSKEYEVQLLHKFNPKNTNQAGIEIRLQDRRSGKLLRSGFFHFAEIFDQEDCFDINPRILEFTACLLEDYTNCSYNKAVKVLPHIFSSFGGGWQYIQGWI